MIILFIIIVDFGQILVFFRVVLHFFSACVAFFEDFGMQWFEL